MWTAKGPVTSNSWRGENCCISINTADGEKEIEVPAWLLKGFEIVPGHDWSVLCSNKNVAQRLHNLTTGEKRGHKEEQKE